LIVIPKSSPPCEKLVRRQHYFVEKAGSLGEMREPSRLKKVDDRQEGPGDDWALEVENIKSS
jgi:hypothetical protein